MRNKQLSAEEYKFKVTKPFLETRLNPSLRRSSDYLSKSFEKTHLSYFHVFMFSHADCSGFNFRAVCLMRFRDFDAELLRWWNCFASCLELNFRFGSRPDENYFEFTLWVNLKVFKKSGISFKDQEPYIRIGVKEYMDWRSNTTDWGTFLKSVERVFWKKIRKSI